MGGCSSSSSASAAVPSGATAAASTSDEACHAAFLFVKPHAVNDKVIQLVKDNCAKNGITIVADGRVNAEDIDKRQFIDVHYGAIAKRAVLQKPAELNVTEKAQSDFESTYGMTWTKAIEDNLVLNATDSAARLNLDANGLEKVWRALEKDGGQAPLKFGGGFYCGKFKDDAGEFFSINAFYLNMRAVYTTPPAEIHFFSVTWPEAKLSWADFRGKVLGATDPSTAPAGSMRRTILDDWESLGLPNQPSKGENGVHGSASPVEGLFERMNWMVQSPASDVYGKVLIKAGIPEAVVKDWANDPVVQFDGAKKSFFDLLEDLNVTECTAKALQILAQNP